MVALYKDPEGKKALKVKTQSLPAGHLASTNIDTEVTNLQTKS